MEGSLFMGRKGKHSQEEIMQYVKEILDGEISVNAQSVKTGIGYTTLRRWITNYQSLGASAFCQTGFARRSAAEKRSAVIDYLSGEGSLTDICKKYKIKSDSVLRKWIAKYNGHEELKSTNSSGGQIMTKGRKTTRDERVKIVEDCIANNNNYNETAEKYQVSYQQVYTWVHKYQDKGVEALEDRRGKRKDEDSMTELEKLKAENRLLKAEKKQQQMELDFLKKLEEIERRRY